MKVQFENQNKFEWDVYSPAIEARNRKKGWLLLTIILSTLFISIF